MMKKLLFTLTAVLLFNSTDSIHASDLNVNTLNSLPDEIKLHIGLQLSTDDQKNLGKANKSFNAIMTDDAVLIRQTASKFGLNFDQIDNFGKQLVKDVAEDNFAITVCNTYKGSLCDIYKGSLDPLIYVDREDGVLYHSVDNNGHIDFVQSVLLNENWQNGDRFLFYGANRDSSLLAGSCLNLRQLDVNEKLQDVAIKYTRDTGKFVYLFPIDSESTSCATGVNTHGDIIVGQINPRDYEFESCEPGKETYGFIHSNDSVIFLKNPRQATSNHPQAVSDKGEVIVGYVMINNKKHAAIWLHDAHDNTYHPCLLHDLVMHNCSDAQRKLLQDNHCTYFDRVLAVSPDGKAMLVKTSNPNTKDSYDRNNIHDIKIIFGTSTLPQYKDRIFIPE